MSKIDQQLADMLFHKNIGYARDEVLQGPAYGVDCALIELPDDKAMVVASDPLSYIPNIGIKESAYISLHLAANDIATSGLSPQYGQCVLNLPESMSKVELEKYWRYISAFANDLGVHITGGHTGRDASSQTTIVGGITLFSIGSKNSVMLSNQAKKGDVLLMTKSAGIISTAILGMSFPHYIVRNLGADVLHRLRENIWTISVLPEGQVIHGINTKAQHAHAMHDVTEGGVLGAIYEFASASNLGVQVFADQIYVEDAIAQTAELFGLDAKEIIGAGSMLIACKPESKDFIIAQFAQKGIRCTPIGEFCAPTGGRCVSVGATVKELDPPQEDPYWAVFKNCMKNELS